MTTMMQPRLTRRSSHMLDDTPIHVGDIVHLQPEQGPRIAARVIYNTPFNGATTYTTDLVPCMAENGRLLKQRFRFRHEHVHRIDPIRS